MKKRKGKERGGGGGERKKVSVATTSIPFADGGEKEGISTICSSSEV